MNFSHKLYFFIIFLIGSFLYFYQYNNTENIFFGEKRKDEVNIFQTKKVQEAIHIIKKEYYKFNEKKQKDIEDGIIKALVGSLGDKHSEYLNLEEKAIFEESLRGDFEGIGAVIDEHLRGIIVRKVISGSPAEKAKIISGDIITSVGEESMVGVKASDAVKKIRGPKGTTVDLTIMNLSGTIEKKSVIRDTIKLPSIEQKMLTGNIGYIGVAFFGENTEKEFQKSLETLISSGATSLIIDMRNNGGGFLETSVDLLSYFLPEGFLVVKTRETNEINNKDYFTSKKKGALYDIPMVVIVNSLSASAAEIFAGALKDYERAIIVGEKTYGKGSVQVPFEMQDGSILKLTIGRWYTPKDINIDIEGIMPDMIIPFFERDLITQYDRQLEWAQKIVTQLRDIKNREKVKEIFMNTNFNE